jgi:hypothetical protein
MLRQAPAHRSTHSVAVPELEPLRERCDPEPELPREVIELDPLEAEVERSRWLPSDSRDDSWERRLVRSWLLTSVTPETS